MKTTQEKLYSAIDHIAEYIYQSGEHIYKNPETGFKEYKTSQYVKEQFEVMGLRCICSEGITGVKVTIDTGKEGTNIAFLAELDALQCSSHPDADPQTGAAHCCGHNIMQADILGLAKALLDSGIKDELCGKIHFIVVPAEEYSEIEYRCKLIEDQKITYPTGKSEFLRRGFFDDVDLAVMLHVMPGNKTVGIEHGGNGFVAKKIRYLGKAAHAASNPAKGINALYAANLGLMAVNSLRETFSEEACVRVHPIITKGGDAVNIIPQEVTIETLVRANNIDDIALVNQKVNHAFIGGAISMGAAVEIQDTPGMMPLYLSQALIDTAKKVATDLVGTNEINDYMPSKGSSDLGDITTLMPAIEICIESITGGLHSSEYVNSDKQKSYITGTKMLGGMMVELLQNNGEVAKKVVEEYSPYFKSKQEYFHFMDSLFAKKIWSDLCD